MGSKGADSSPFMRSQVLYAMARIDAEERAAAKARRKVKPRATTSRKR